MTEVTQNTKKRCKRVQEREEGTILLWGNLSKIFSYTFPSKLHNAQPEQLAQHGSYLFGSLFSIQKHVGLVHTTWWQNQSSCLTFPSY